MIYKDGVLNFTVTQSANSPITTGIQFSTQDVATAKLTFKLTKDGVPLPLSAVSGRLILVMSDGSRFIREITLVDKVNGIAEYVLSDAEIKHYGQVNAELYLYYTNGQSMSVHKFGFTIDKALIDQNIVPVSEYYIDDFESLKAKIEELYDDSVRIIEELRAKFADLENIETKAGAQEKADVALSDAKAYTDQHATDKANPHNVTKAQVGLGNVDNVRQAAKQDFDNHVSDAVRHVTADERTMWNSAESNAKAYTDVHEKRKDNPHEVTKAQVGLDKVDNVQQASLADFNAHNYNSVRHVTQADKDRWNSILNSTPVWQTPPLSNGWSNYDPANSQIKYSKNIFGEVTIWGAITGGTLGNVPAFTLPDDCRPLYPVYYIGVASGKGMGSVPQTHRTVVNTDGTVFVQASSNTVNPVEFITMHIKFRTT